MTAFAIALLVQGGLIGVWGAITDWCFCAVTEAPSPPIPPPFVMRFIEMAAVPSVWMWTGLPPLAMFVLNLAAWTEAVLLLLYGMMFVARLRLRPPGGLHGRRLWLAGREHVRPAHLLVMSCVLIAAALAGGAMLRHRWMSRAERVFAATMEAARAGRPLPADVKFSMYERRGDGFEPVSPAEPFVAEIDPEVSGDHLLDAFVAPYEYGGTLRFASGGRYRFSVYREPGGGWTVSVHPGLGGRRRW